MKWCPTHPLADSRGYALEARVILYDQIGNGPHKCHWCGRAVRWLIGRRWKKGALVTDHLDHDRHNNAPDNLVPSCQPCNAARTKSRIQPGERSVMWAGKRVRAIERTCDHCGTVFLIPPSATSRGRGRFCSRSCARSSPRR